MRGVGRHEVSALLGRSDAAFSSRGGPNRVCGRDGVPAAPAGGRDSTPLPVQTLGFALLGDSLFSNARMAGPSKVSKNACPCIRPRLRRGSLAPMMFQGPAAKGHPCPIAALAASMPPTPLHITCARPPERGVRRHLIVRLSRNRQSVFVSLFANLQTPRSQSPFSNVGWKTAQHFPALTTAELLPNHADSIRPINRGGRRRLIGHLSANKRSAFVSLFTIFQAARSRLPFRRPSVVAVEGQATNKLTLRIPSLAHPGSGTPLRLNPEATNLPSRGKHP